MAIDPTISLRVQPPEPIRSPWDSMAKFEMIRGQRQENLLREQQIEDRKAIVADRTRKMADDSTVRAIVAKNTPVGKPTQWQKVWEELNGQGLVDQAAAIQANFYEAQDKAVKSEKDQIDLALRQYDLADATVRSIVDPATHRIAKLSIMKTLGPEWASQLGNTYDDFVDRREELGRLSEGVLKDLKAKKDASKAEEDYQRAVTEGKLKGLELQQKQREFVSQRLRTPKNQAEYATVYNRLALAIPDDVLSDFVTPERWTKDTPKQIEQMGLTSKEAVTENRATAAQAMTHAHQVWLEQAPARDKEKRAAERPLEVAQRIAAIVSKPGITVDDAQKAWQAESGQYLTAYQQLDVEWANRTLRGYFQGVTGEQDAGDLAVADILRKIGGGTTTPAPGGGEPPKPSGAAVPDDVKGVLNGKKAGTSVDVYGDGSEVWTIQKDGSIKRTK